MSSSTFVVLVALVACSLGAPQLGNYFNSKILNGKNAGPGEFPYIVSLQYNDQHFCGGSILNANWILTAAHCLDGIPGDYLTVVSGTTNLNAVGNSNDVSRSIIHEAYNKSNSWINDIGLLQLSSPLTLSGNVKPVKLPAQDQEAAGGLSVIASGWGLSFSGPVSNKLQKLTQTLFTNEQCQSKTPDKTIFETSLCGGGVIGQGVCKGDSGGPLVDGKNAVIVGVASWTRGCALGSPDVYTRVAKYINWINENTK